MEQTRAGQRARSSRLASTNARCCSCVRVCTNPLQMVHLSGAKPQAKLADKFSAKHAHASVCVAHRHAHTRTHALECLMINDCHANFRLAAANARGARVGGRILRASSSSLSSLNERAGTDNHIIFGQLISASAEPIFSSARARARAVKLVQALTTTAATTTRVAVARGDIGRASLSRARASQLSAVRRRATQKRRLMRGQLPFRAHRMRSHVRAYTQLGLLTMNCATFAAAAAVVAAVVVRT